MTICVLLYYPFMFSLFYVSLPWAEDIGPYWQIQLRVSVSINTQAN